MGCKREAVAHDFRSVVRNFAPFEPSASMKGRKSHKTREFDERRQALKARVASLVGARVSGVRYVELTHEGLPEHWHENPDLDSLDFGLEFDLDDGRVVSIAWDWQFESHDLNVFEGALQPERVSSGAAIYDVGNRSRWSELLGRRIEDARLDWARWDPGGEFPQDLVLRFEGDRTVWIMAAEQRGDDWLSVAMDHVTVAFDDALPTSLVGREWEARAHDSRSAKRKFAPLEPSASIKVRKHRCRLAIP